MQVSYFETGRYYAPSNLPRQWPMPAGAYDREAGSRAFRGMIERSRYVEELGFDWVSVSEHHYSPRILTPSLPIAAAYIAAHVHNIKIALLGPIVPQSNPVRLAEEMAMLDTMAEGRLIVGMLRGTTNEMLTYDLNPEELRERRARSCAADAGCPISRRSRTAAPHARQSEPIAQRADVGRDQPQILGDERQGAQLLLGRGEEVGAWTGHSLAGLRRCCSGWHMPGGRKPTEMIQPNQVHLGQQRPQTVHAPSVAGATNGVPVVDGIAPELPPGR